MRGCGLRFRRAAAAIALTLSVVAGCGAASATNSTAATSTSALPGTPGHFDNGDFSFDYPATWRTLSGLYDETIVNEVDAVMGTGDWRTGCAQTMYPDGRDNISCTGDKFDVSGGRIVVKVWRQVGGPVDTCRADLAGNATLGPNAVLQSGSGAATTWEIREPGGQFGWGYNVFIEVHTDGAAELVAAKALVASFRWAAGRTNGGCSELDTSAPSPTVVPSST
jgi:hypothetical protein